jgi:hypothetical protein
MPISTLQLVTLRIIAVSICRVPPFARWFKRFLVFWLIKRKEGTDRYVASSNFFDWSDLDP